MTSINNSLQLSIKKLLSKIYNLKIQLVSRSSWSIADIFTLILFSSCFSFFSFTYSFINKHISSIKMLFIIHGTQSDEEDEWENKYSLKKASFFRNGCILATYAGWISVKNFNENLFIPYVSFFPLHRL